MGINFNDIELQKEFIDEEDARCLDIIKEKAVRNYWAKLGIIQPVHKKEKEV